MPFSQEQGESVRKRNVLLAAPAPPPPGTVAGGAFAGPVMSRRGRGHRRSRTLGDLDAADAEPGLSGRESTSSLLRLANGDSQSGQLNAAGQLEGFGVYYWHKSRDCYRGFFKQGKPDGRGSLTFGRTGDRYCGEWKEGQICGAGKMTRLDGSIT